MYIANSRETKILICFKSIVDMLSGEKKNITVKTREVRKCWKKRNNRTMNRKQESAYNIKIQID